MVSLSREWVTKPFRQVIIYDSLICFYLSQKITFAIGGQSLHSIFCHRNPILHIILWKNTNFELFKVTKTWSEKDCMASFNQSTSRSFQKYHIYTNIRDFVDGLCYPSWPFCNVGSNLIMVIKLIAMHWDNFNKRNL